MYQGSLFQSLAAVGENAKASAWIGELSATADQLILRIGVDRKAEEGQLDMMGARLLRYLKTSNRSVNLTLWHTGIQCCGAVGTPK